MDGIIESILNFGTSFFILEDVDMSNEGLREDFCLYNHALFAMFIFFKFLKTITLLLNYMVVLVLTSNLGVWCVVDFCMLWSFAFDGKG